MRPIGVPLSLFFLVDILMIVAKAEEGEPPPPNQTPHECEASTLISDLLVCSVVSVPFGSGIYYAAFEKSAKK